MILWEDLTFWTAIGQLALGLLAGLTVGIILREARRLVLPPITPLPEGGICPACGGHSLRRFRGSLARRVVSVFTRRWPYHCRRCGWPTVSSAPGRMRPTAQRTPNLSPPLTVLDTENIVGHRKERVVTKDVAKDVAKDVTRDVTKAVTKAVTKDDVADVKAAVLRYLAMLNAGDVGTRANCYLSEFTSFGVDGGPLAWRGFDWRTSAPNAGQTYDLRCRDLRVYVHKDTAIATAYLVGTITRPDGASTPVAGRTSWVHLRQDGEWKIAHTHLSPFNHDS